MAPRTFQAEEPETHPVETNQVWASDISYIPTDEGFVFIGTYLGLFTRKLRGLQSLITCEPSFFVTLEKEQIFSNRNKVKSESKKAIFDYIEGWHNRWSLDASLGYQSPIQFEDSLAAWMSVHFTGMSSITCRKLL